MSDWKSLCFLSCYVETDVVCTWLVMISQHDRESCCTIKVTWYPIQREVYKPHTLRDTLALQDEKIFKAPLSFTCEIKKATGDLSRLIITLKVGVISQVFTPWANKRERLLTESLCLLQFLFLSRPSCPLPFPLGSVVSPLTHCWWTTLFFHLVPRRRFPVMDLP